MPPELPIDEDYASDEDSDFAPDAVPAEGASDASESEEESNDQPRATAQKRKRSTGGDDAATATAADSDDGFENSGDEAIIQKAKKRKKRAKQKDGAAAAVAAAEDDEGGEGGLIKTRSMRAQEKAERKSHAITGPVTVDVDELWAKMTAAPVVPPKTDPEQLEREKENQRRPSRGEDLQEEEKGSEARRGQENKGGNIIAEPPAMIKIKRTYNFAGKVHTEEKLVSRESAEAKLYLASLGAEAAAATAAAAADDAAEEAQPKSKPRKAFRSIFEPIVEGLAAQHQQRADLNLGMAARLQLREQQAQAKAKKLNVVEKSRMDWAGYVDQEGIKDELELAGKSKDSYVHRQDFLARVEANREEEARRARVAGRA